MIFNKLKENDVEILNKYLLSDKSRSCEKIVADLMMWREFYKIEWCVFENTLIIKYDYPEKNCFLTPVGDNVEKAVTELGKVTFVGVVNEDIDKIKREDSIIIKDRNNFDYIYNADDLRFFKGKKLHAKKNFLNRFNSMYKSSFVINPPKSELIDFFTLIDRIQPHYDETGVAELNETIDVIENREKFHVVTGAVYVNGEMVAASAGSEVGDTLYIHIEKANREYTGSYQAIVSEFAKAFPNAEYINREDDLGEDGLRQSKLSYQPVYLLEKSRIIN